MPRNQASNFSICPALGEPTLLATHWAWPAAGPRRVRMTAAAARRRRGGGCPTLPRYEPTYNPSYAPSTYEPSSMPTETPTYAPSYGPTDGACDADYCWADETVAEFGCSDNTHVFPVQIMRLSDDDEHYSVLELEYEEGNYDLMYDVEYFDGHINAAAMFVTASEDAFFSFASFGGYLCRFDESHAVCFATPLASDSPNAAAIIGNTYYYAKNFGNNIQNSHIYWVGDIHTDRPDFHDGHEFTMSPELYKSSVLDFVAVEEYGAEMIVDMYDEDGTYLIGIALGYEVVVVHVNRATKKPDKYAVLDAVVDWGDADDHSDDDNSFGAAFAYKLLRHADLYASYRLFFASNEGYGIMELATGFEIPDDCWNEGDDVENHAKCDATVALDYLGPSEPTHYNDGLNCPNGDLGVLAPTAAPTEEPCTGRLCWDDVAVDEFDCETNYNPVQVMRYDDASLYGAYELNFDDGAYHLLYELDYFDGHINAVALYDGGKKGYYAMGSFGGYLCRFDAAAKVCFDDALEFSSPNVGAIVDKRYYYAKNLGEADDNGEIFWVDLIHTDEPEFYADSAFAVAPALYGGAVLDFSGVEEDGDELFDDRYADAGYLVGLSTDFELLVVHLSGQSGYPDAYAVFDSQVDFDGFDPADDDTGGFGASFVYNANGDTKIYVLEELVGPLRVHGRRGVTDLLGEEADVVLHGLVLLERVAPRVLALDVVAPDARVLAHVGVRDVGVEGLEDHGDGHEHVVVQPREREDEQEAAALVAGLEQERHVRQEEQDQRRPDRRVREGHHPPDPVHELLLVGVPRALVEDVAGADDGVEEEAVQRHDGQRHRAAGHGVLAHELPEGHGGPVAPRVDAERRGRAHGQEQRRGERHQLLADELVRRAGVVRVAVAELEQGVRVVEVVDEVVAEPPTPEAAAARQADALQVADALVGDVLDELAPLLLADLLVVVRVELAEHAQELVPVLHGPDQRQQDEVVRRPQQAHDVGRLRRREQLLDGHVAVAVRVEHVEDVERLADLDRRRRVARQRVRVGVPVLVGAVLALLERLQGLGRRRIRALGLHLLEERALLLLLLVEHGDVAEQRALVLRQARPAAAEGRTARRAVVHGCDGSRRVAAYLAVTIT